MTYVERNYFYSKKSDLIFTETKWYLSFQGLCDKTLMKDIQMKKEIKNLGLNKWND